MSGLPNGKCIYWSIEHREAVAQFLRAYKRVTAPVIFEHAVEWWITKFNNGITKKGEEFHEGRFCSAVGYIRKAQHNVDQSV